ncbi:MAG: thermonuclease family protein [Candidatus Fonsibacter ubiquis]
MIIIPLILTLLFSKPDLAKADPKDKFYPAVVERVKDGDTIELKTDTNLYDLKFSVRIYGIDPPELKSNFLCEKKMAQKSKEYIESLLPEGTKIYLKNPKHDKFGGRILADIKIKDNLISELLIKKKLAIEYFGEKKTHVWCKD